MLLFATLYLVILVAGLVLWAAATATGVRENIEKFIGDLIASDDFRILGGTMLRASVVGGLVLVVMGTGANVLLAVLYNLISDVVGGIIVVFEERPTRRRTRRPAPTQPFDGDQATAPLKPSRGPRRGMSRPMPRSVDTTPEPDLPQVQPETVTPAELTPPSD